MCQFWVLPKCLGGLRMDNLFETLRKIIMSCAYKRGMWQAVQVDHRMYRRARQRRIDMYTTLIEMCYKEIADLKEKGMIE